MVLIKNGTYGIQMKHKYLVILFWLIIMVETAAQDEIKAGPMVGYMEMAETLIWLQTHRESSLRIKYWPADSPQEVHWSQPVMAQKKQFFIVKVPLEQLKPGTVYTYQIYRNEQLLSFSYPLEFKTKTQWQFSLQPPDFKVALGSCVYINDPPYDPSDKVHGGGYPLYEFTVSPLTSKAYPPFPEETNVPFRVPNTLYMKRNFGLIKFSGKKNQRQMTLEIYSSKGHKIWDHIISENDLKY